MKKKTTLFENGLIWFGAGISIAEILTGTYYKDLGFINGLWAIIAGHVIGCVLLYLAGVIGGVLRKSSMETVKISFGGTGGQFFALMNIIQLVGWTGIMIYDGAIAANSILDISTALWSVVIGVLIAIWISVGITNLKVINIISMSGLFIMTLILCKIIFSGFIETKSTGLMSFGAGVELAVAMPLSWLPLISDYTMEAENPKKASLVSTVVYGLISTFMYIIGMGAALFTGESDIALILLKAGLGVCGLLIVVFSTVTTTFLDAYSAGISTVSVFKKANGKYVGIGVTVIGTLLAVFFPMDDITGFLYFIGSVFAPMTAILIADVFILKKNKEQGKFNIKNTLIWLVGFILYRYLMTVDIIIGNTLPTMVAVILICIALKNVAEKKKL